MTALRAATDAIRPLGVADLATVQALVDAEPYAHAVLAARLERARGVSLAGELLGIGASDRLDAACYVGGNVLPVGGGPESWMQLAQYLGRRPRTCSSIIATADTISVLWPALAPRWGPARAVRACQPLLMLDAPAVVGADPYVRPARRHELDRYLPAAAAMFDEEMGLTPLRGPTAHAYRSRIEDLIACGRAFVRTDSWGEVVFKAELAAVSRRTSQVQGVWVRPDCRGRGIASAAMAAVVEYALRLAPSVSLYVNDYNVPARRLYARLGMRPVGTLATVLF